MFTFLLEISIEIIAYLQTELAWLAPVMRFFTFLGNVEFYLLVMPLFVWSVDYTLGLRLGVMLMLSSAVNTFLKLGFHQPRPYWVSPEIQNLIAPMGSFGLPSGHSQNAASVFGLLAASSKKKWVRRLLMGVILLVAFSRLYLGVHSLADIALGLAAGVLLLWLYLRLEHSVQRFFNGLKPLAQIGAVFLITIGLLWLAGGILSVVREIPLPDLWLENTRLAHPEEAILPYSIEGVVTACGALFGLGAGYILFFWQGGYHAPKGNAWQHLSRFMIGIAGVLAIWRGLGLLLPGGEDLLGISFRYLRYALIGVWITGAAPALFIRAKLAHKQ